MSVKKKIELPSKKYIGLSNIVTLGFDWPYIYAHCAYCHVNWSNNSGQVCLLERLTVFHNIQTPSWNQKFKRKKGR